MPNLTSLAFRRKQFVYQALPPKGGTTNSVSVYVYKLIQIDNRVAKIAQSRRFRLFIFALRISIGLRLQKRQRPFHLFRVRSAVQSDLERPDDLGAAICARLFRDPLGEKARLLQHEFIVHQRQRLWRDGRDGARRPRDDSRRAIEDLDQRQQDRAFDEYVDAAPPRAVIVFRVERPARARAGVDHVGIDARIYAGAEHFGVQLAADGEDAVPQRLGFETARIHPPQQPVFRVFGGGLLVESARLAVGIREQDQTMHRLPTPATLHEFGRHPVEQLGMARTISRGAEIAGRLHDALPEMVLPDAIDGHARGQRVVGARDPFGQLATAISRIEVHVASQDLRRPRLNFFALVPPIAAFEQVGLARIAFVSDAHRRRQRFWPRPVDFIYLVLNLFARLQLFRRKQGFYLFRLQFDVSGEAFRSLFSVLFFGLAFKSARHLRQPDVEFGLFLEQLLAHGLFDHGDLPQERLGLFINLFVAGLVNSLFVF